MMNRNRLAVVGVGIFFVNFCSNQIMDEIELFWG
jgi:hypothetical protein